MHGLSGRLDLQALLERDVAKFLQVNDVGGDIIDIVGLEPNLLALLLLHEV